MLGMATEIPVTPFMCLHILDPEVSRQIDQHRDDRGNTK